MHSSPAPAAASTDVTMCDILVPAGTAAKPAPCQCYSHLPTVERLILADCARKAFAPPARWTRFFHCMVRPRPVERQVSRAALRLIAYIHEHCTEAPLLFRCEGPSRTLYKQMAHLLAMNKLPALSIDSLPNLASALKTYIREYLDGLFDTSIIRGILITLRTGTPAEITRDFKRLFCSLSDTQRECLFALRRLFNKMDANQEASQMSRASLQNIFSLTLSPSGTFKTIEDSELSTVLFNRFMALDLEALCVCEFQEECKEARKHFTPIEPFVPARLGGIFGRRVARAGPAGVRGRSGG